MAANKRTVAGLSRTDRIQAHTAKTMTTAKKLWLGFGTLTTLLVLFGVLMLVRLPSIERNVHRMADTARPRSDATRELTLSVLDYAVIVSTHLDDRLGRSPATKVAAAEVDRHLAAYEILVETSRQRELAARFAAKWRGLYALGETLGDTVPATPEEVERFDAMRIQLEKFLNDDMQWDAVESYNAHKETAFQDLRALFGFLVILTAGCVVASMLTSIAVGRSIVRTEEALRESEERLRMAQAAGGVGTFDWDFKSNAARCSEEYFHVMGAAARKSHSVTFEEWQLWLHPDDRERVLGELGKHLANDDERASDYRIVCADGQTRWISYRGRITRNQAGEVIRMLGTVHDISDRKRAEENLSRLTTELHAKVEELSTLIDILPGAVLMADPECRRITGNRAFYEIIGLPQGANASLTAEQPDLPAGTCVYRDGRKLPPDEFPMQATGRSGRRIMDFDHDLVFPDGRVVSLLANTAPLLDEQGTVRGILGFYMDISERKRAEDALRDRTARLRAILNTAADAIITIDAKGIVQSVNTATERMFDYPAAEMIGRNIKMLMPSPYRDEHDRYLENHDKTGVNNIIGIGREVVAQRKDGSTFPVDLAISKVDRLNLFTGILRDITRRKQTEEELRRKERELTEAQRIAHVGSWSWDAKSDTTTGSDEFFRIFGLDPATQSFPAFREFDGRLFVSESWQRLNAAVQESMQTGVGYELELEALRGNVRIWIKTRSEVLRNADGQIVGLRGTVKDITQRKMDEQLLRESERFARSTLDGLSAHIAILDESGTILAVNEPWRAFAAANSPVSGNVEEGANYLRICESNVGQFSDEGPAAAAGIRAVLSKMLPEFTMEYPCHGPHEQRWFLMRVTRFPGDGPRRVVVAHENITKRKELEREVVEIASLEQRRIGQDLHDSVGQELTALNMLAGDLAETLRMNPGNESKLVERMVQGLQRSQKELRAVMRGLLPVAVDTEGLMAALSDLTDRIQLEGKVTCTFDCPEPVSVTDNLTATHLYLIAQEAVHNAVKHARPRNISIVLVSNEHLRLNVQDDGIGMPAQLTETNGGLGLRIMRNRASIIGATLTIESAEPTGTLVTCTLMSESP